jgi:hypothetical protein
MGVTEEWAAGEISVRIRRVSLAGVVFRVDIRQLFFGGIKFLRDSRACKNGQRRSQH